MATGARLGSSAKFKMWTKVKSGKVKIFAKIKGAKYEVPEYAPYVPFSVGTECKPLVDRSAIATVYRMRQAMYGRNIGEYPYQLGDQFVKYNSAGARDYSAGIAKVLWADPCGWMVEVEIPKLGRYYANYDDMNKILKDYGYKKLG